MCPDLFEMNVNDKKTNISTVFQNVDQTRVGSHSGIEMVSKNEHQKV